MTAMLRCPRRTAATAAAPLAADLLAACASASAPEGAPAAGTTAPKPVPYSLYTHCGIDYARVGNRDYETTPPLSDGSGNPPPAGATRTSPAP